ncbi:MAG: valine--tRNA ligase [Candidatus Thorarchaeota archaeon]
MVSKTFAPALTSTRWTAQSEEALIDTWSNEKTYAFNPHSRKTIYSVDTPPPYLSGHVHLGQLIHYTQIDMIARYRRMQGFEVNFPLGLDRNGLPVELRVEKEHGISMHSTPRDEFVRRCKEELDHYEKEVIQAFKRAGLSFNTYDEDGIYRTDSPDYRAVTQATFIDLWRRGLIYSDYRPNNWCFECGTTIADAEVEYSERTATLNYLYFEVPGAEPLKIATTRPELLCACGAVFVHPEDERYRNYVGKKAIVPLFGLEVPIIESRTVLMDFGTGALMVCSYGDIADVMAFRDHALKPIAAVGPDGRMTSAAGKYAGLTTEEARRQIISDLKERGILYKQEPTLQRVPLCWRSDTPIEFIAMDEYYLKQTEFIEDLLKISEDITFYPAHHRQILLDWLNRVSVDWPVSRRRFYGTEIPIWYCNKCGSPVLPDSNELRYYRPWCESPPFDTCPKCGARSGFRGEERTFDTWMDSSISGLQIIGYLRDPTLFKRGFKRVLRPQGKDIVRTWLYYSLLRTYQLLKAPAFREVWISGHVVDEKGEKMSKSRGNSPDPLPIIERYGADALRLFGVLEAGLGSDVRFEEERLAGVSKFMTKLWNIARFISMFPSRIRLEFSQLTPVDRWILAETNNLLKRITPDCERLDFHRPAVEVRSFTWNFLADHILELLKGRCLNAEEHGFTESEQKSGWYALHESLKVVLRCLAPMCPFITDTIYRELYDSRGVHRARFPTPNDTWKSDLTDRTELLLSINMAIWKYKKDAGLSLRNAIPEVWLPVVVEPWVRDLAAMHGIGRVQLGEPDDQHLVGISLPNTAYKIFIRPS